MEKNVERHKPPKYVVKAILSIWNYCKCNVCEMCPYNIKRYDEERCMTVNGCLFNYPCNKEWDKWINDNYDILNKKQ